MAHSKIPQGGAQEVHVLGLTAGDVQWGDVTEGPFFHDIQHPNAEGASMEGMTDMEGNSATGGLPVGLPHGSIRSGSDWRTASRSGGSPGYSNDGCLSPCDSGLQEHMVIANCHYDQTEYNH